MRAECLVFALLNHEGAGVWGGMLYHDRMNMKRNRALSRSDWVWHPPTPKVPKVKHDADPSESLAA
ncbi:WhiB family transcriptional regulator [Streptomyces atratus]|uniref:WhiB family transcriptional regulator n=1 Tax=Streptomyces atratus TaxID=1893 RepID=UPI00365E4C56